MTRILFILVALLGPWSLVQSAPIDDAIATNNSSVNVTLTVSNPLNFPRNNEPVSNGVPLARGQASDTAELWLQDENGNNVPAQFTVLSRWNAPISDTAAYIKWVLVDFQATLAPNQSARFTLGSNGSGVNIDSPGAQQAVVITDNGSFLQVQNGKLSFRLDKSSLGGIIEELMLDNNGDGDYETSIIEAGTSNGVVITNANGQVYSSRNTPTRKHRVDIVQRGSMHSVIELSGEHLSNTQDAPNAICSGRCSDRLDYLEYKIRIHVYANHPALRLFYSVTNPEQASTAQLNFGGNAFYHRWQEYSIDLNLASDGSIDYIFGAESPDDHRYPGDKSADANTGSPNYANSLLGDGNAGLFQLGSGFDNTTGYQIYDNGSLSSSGLQASGWATLNSGRWQAGIGLRHFWENFPKALEVSGNGNALLHLWPAQGQTFHKFGGGRRKTHEMTIGAWPVNADQGDTMPDNAMIASLEPMHALASPSHYQSTLAMGFEPIQAAEPEEVSERFWTSAQLAVDDARDVWFERASDNLYGWRDWGDAYRNGKPNFGNNEFDLTYGNISAYLLGLNQDRKLFELAESQARHLADSDTYHTDRDVSTYNRGIYRHDFGLSPDVDGDYIGHNNTPETTHAWIRGELLYYLFIGNRMALESALEAGDWFNNLIDDQGFLIYGGSSRSQAWTLLALVELWETTGDLNYLQQARSLAEADIISEQGLGDPACPDLDWERQGVPVEGVKPLWINGSTGTTEAVVWMNGYTAEALGRLAVAERMRGSPNERVETALKRLLDAIDG